jgi:zinc-ribbon domain
MPSFRALPKRAADKAHAAAAGSTTPAGQEPPPAAGAARPSARERASMRRRIRKAGRIREALVRELGTLVLEMQRLDRRNDELIRRKAREIEALDRELSGLAVALGRRQTLSSVVATGVAGACPACGTLIGTEDRFCSHCGKPMVDEPGAADDGAVLPPPAQLQLEPVGAERP